MRLLALLHPRDSNHSWRSRKRFPAAPFSSFFCFGFGEFSKSHQFPDTPSSRRKLAGIEEVLDESCGNDEEDELEQIPGGIQGTTTGTKISVLQRNVFPLLVKCGF